MKVRRFRQSMLAVAVWALTLIGCATSPQVPQNVQCTPETVAAFRAKTQAIQANAATDTGSYNAGLIPIVGGFFAVGNYSEKRSQAAQIMAEAQALDAACKAAGYPDRKYNLGGDGVNTAVCHNGRYYDDTAWTQGGPRGSYRIRHCYQTDGSLKEFKLFPDGTADSPLATLQ
jgi:hypothetical protein